MGLPDNAYQRVEATRWRHVWVVGDIHGCFSLLMAKLRLCHFDPLQDLLVSVGDVIDRGPDSLRCLKLLRKRWIIAVRGNHEQMGLDALATGEQFLWFMNGGSWFAQAEQPAAKAALETCRQLPWILELRCQNGIHVIAHADYPDDNYQWQKEVDLQRVLWDRTRLMNKGNGIRGADHFWFGHTPLRQRLDHENLHYIDTGAVFGGELTLVQLQ
ncbi:protein-serine/threonine phosphatase [Citrobacter braakii]|jgi:serine/threonine protein phosphatase 1|uniref:protein-serine/threonine phosphatase n=1 Tax=Citrobacter TaxID=544 RepID=UPI001E59D9D4|nr:MULTISPECIES: protein-serine/threonine phosphatase [Citrobacter]MCW1433774.1 protein-serine/threonine phosphatase [Citrobacter freundii]MCD9263347.1 protein-serine/threonine phosphatase [Citrobacter braakii]MCW1445298.1 protein-serine/threonine phosphatase [Citrobacter freundii]MCZ5391995.1 protein-serine/threonine phosphatase [Citrobacter braakii]MDM3326006.1 protein-serine/threonine phosphatase [Citrobacter sp. Cb080]